MPTAVLLVLHVPVPGDAVRGVHAPSQTTVAPVMAEGSAFTVITNERAQPVGSE